jgi:arylsulfatase
MWAYYYNYYLNAIRDDDEKLQMINNTLTDMNLWKNTIVIFTADHGDMGGTHGGLRGKGPMAYEENSHVPLIIAHPDAAHGVSCQAITSHLDLLPTMIGFTNMHSPVSASLHGHDFSALLRDPSHAGVNTVRSGILFNYVGLSTVDSGYSLKIMVSDFKHEPSFPSLTEINLGKRGFLTFVFDGRYKFARYYAPNAFNTPKTMEEIFKNNDVQLFDLKNDPAEMKNLALQPEQNKLLILRMNDLMNNLLAKEVGVNDGGFLPEAVRPK